MTDEAGRAGAPARLVELAMQLAALLVTAIASISFVAFVGAVVLWSRFEAAQLPADQAVAVQTEADLVTVGAIALVLFVLGGLLAVLLLRILDAQGRPTLRTRRGLLVVVGLEILAGYLVEQWDASEGAVLLIVALIGLVAIGVLLEQAARWVALRRKPPIPKLVKRIRQIFGGRIPSVDAQRLWAALMLLTASVCVLALWAEPRERYAAGSVLLAAGLAMAVWHADKGPERTWGIVIGALGLSAAATAVLIRESGWLATIAGIALLLGAVNLSIAHVSGNRFVWYGVTAFVSVMLFGTAFNLLRALEDPQAQGVALLRTNDAEPLCGIFVAENDDRLYYARVDLKGTANVRRLRAESGRLLWAPRGRLVAAEVGRLESLAKAQATAMDLRQELAQGAEATTAGSPSTVTVPRRPPPSAAGLDPCGPGAAQQQRRGSPELELAQRFQPRLLLSRRDDFWPVSVLTLFDLVRRGKVLCRAPTCVPLRSPADLPFTGGENEWLEYPGSHTDRSQQHDQLVSALGTADPFRTSRQYFLVRRDPASGTISLQYWYFYTFNYQPLGFGRAGYHEGDFEHVGVLLSRDSKPRAVWMARHDDEGQVMLWGEPALRTRGDHADVYVARGSHASYESCIEQQRRRAPLGFINDRPECEGSRQIALEPGQTPLFDLSRARWACWGGRFGHTRSGISKLEWELIEANGPRSPLWQQTYDDVPATPCRDATIPENLVSEGEEPLPDASAEAIVQGAGRLDELVDECDDWRRPQAQGAYVAACSPGALAGWVRAGMPDGAAPGLQVLTPRDPAASTTAAMPIAVRRDALSRSFQGWRIRTAQAAAVDVYASCYVRETPLEATFTGVRVAPASELRLDVGAEGRWRLLEDGVRPVAQAMPRLPGEADGPNAPEKRPASTRCR
jgi:hypothetical protein